MIPPGKVAKYFFDRFPEIRPSTNGWYDFTCPFCGVFKGAVHFEEDKVKCWRGCFNGDSRHFIAELEQISLSQAWKLLVSIEGEVYIETANYKSRTPKLKEEISIPYPEHFRPLGDPSPLLGQRAINYLENRGFDVAELDVEGWGYCEDGRYMGRVIIPFFVRGILRYFQARTFMNHPKRYDNPKRDDIGVGKEDVIYNEDALMLYDTVYILEGAMDAKCLGPSATSTQGWSLSRWQLSKYLNATVKTLILIPDVSYYRKALETALLLAPVKKVIVLNLDPLAEYGKDVNEIGKERVLSLPHAVLSVDDIMEKLLE